MAGSSPAMTAMDGFHQNDPIVIIAGPTASGKSALAMDVAAEFSGTVINADSMQVYRELNVLTARPSADDEARVPHRLFGFVPSAEAFSVGGWLDSAAAEIQHVRGEERLPVVVGGTGLYLKALTEGLAPIPHIPQAVRTEARSLYERLGGEAFARELAALDPGAAEALPPGDRQRLIRAYEVARATGRTLDHWQREPTSPAVSGRFVTIALIPPREALYAATDGRFERMVDEGALDEVVALDGLNLDPGLPAMKSLGVRELRQYLLGQVPLETAVENAKRVTRNFAKRQLTWLRHQISADLVIKAQYSESNRREILSFIRDFLLTGQS
jgi:tRNA dimethylallyltransferase